MFAGRCVYLCMLVYARVSSFVRVRVSMCMFVFACVCLRMLVYVCVCVCLRFFVIAYV